MEAYWKFQGIEIKNFKASEFSRESRKFIRKFIFTNSHFRP